MMVVRRNSLVCFIEPIERKKINGIYIDSGEVPGNLSEAKFPLAGKMGSIRRQQRFANKNFLPTHSE